ncbi:uncharacterized protein TNCV_2802431 [Trichonephila clavipes]|nr:uncharacterized protein TNCV_2802431 [Trichonephila clavipes]
MEGDVVTTAEELDKVIEKLKEASLATGITDGRDVKKILNNMTMLDQSINSRRTFSRTEPGTPTYPRKQLVCKQKFEGHVGRCIDYVSDGGSVTGVSPVPMGLPRHVFSAVFRMTGHDFLQQHLHQIRVKDTTDCTCLCGEAMNFVHLTVHSWPTQVLTFLQRLPYIELLVGKWPIYGPFLSVIEKKKCYMGLHHHVEIGFMSVN